MNDVTVRPIRAHEWRERRDQRLRALQDDAAAIAFTVNYAEAAARPDESWREVALSSSIDAGPDAPARQFVAVTGDGEWVGTLTVLIELEGDLDFEGKAVARSGGGIVGVYVDPAFRGQGLLARLFEAAFDWVRERGFDHARLYVHADNVRARAAYEKVGFAATGVTLTGLIGPELELARRV